MVSFLTHSSTHSLTHLLTYLLTYLLTHSLATKVKEFDENYKVSEKFSEKLTQFYTFAVQIDEKYAISPTAGRIITASSEVRYLLTLFAHYLTYLRL